MKKWKAFAVGALAAVLALWVGSAQATEPTVRAWIPTMNFFDDETWQTEHEHTMQATLPIFVNIPANTRLTYLYLAFEYDASFFSIDNITSPLTGSLTAFNWNLNPNQLPAALCNWDGIWPNADTQHRAFAAAAWGYFPGDTGPLGHGNVDSLAIHVCDLHLRGPCCLEDRNDKYGKAPFGFTCVNGGQGSCAVAIHADGYEEPFFEYFRTYPGGASWESGCVTFYNGDHSAIEADGKYDHCSSEAPFTDCWPPRDCPPQVYPPKPSALTSELPWSRIKRMYR